MFSRPLYKTDDIKAYFVDQWERMHSLTLETVSCIHSSLINSIWPVRHMYTVQSENYLLRHFISSHFPLSEQYCNFVHDRFEMFEEKKLSPISSLKFSPRNNAQEFVASEG